PLVAQSSTAIARGAAAITEEDVRRHIFIIADDSMGGRGTPSRGLELTARYVAAQFEKAGFAPGGDAGSYLQRFPIPTLQANGGGGARRAGALGASIGAGTGASADTFAYATSAPNVVGILEGTDPELRNEYVVFSAHMDHVGIRVGEGPDSIYNGADDDGSGTVGVIELAEAFAAARPRRSIILLTVSGEEKGLWGSDFFAGHPPVPIDRIVADLNMDMIGRNWKDTIVVIGKEHSDLGATLNRVNAEHPELNMHAIDDLWPQENFYFRSDHFNFARRGVPALFFFNGTHADYHEVSDSPDRIDVEKEARIIQLVYYIGLEVANSPERPLWNPDSYKKIVGHKE
ncbi:MAG: M28 family peptidase, partial [Gemmatimonadaceae bacterium]